MTAARRKVRSADLRLGSRCRWKGHLIEFVERVPRRGRIAARNVFRCEDFVGLADPDDPGYLIFTDHALAKEVEWAEER